MKDIFLCHAREDKAAVVETLAFELERRGISCWIDEAQIRLGQSITEQVNEGLKTSRYVVVVLSPAFMAKNWPKRELWAAINMEASSGEVKVICVLSGTHEDMRLIIQALPILNDKLYARWDGAADLVARDLQRAISSQPLPVDEDIVQCGKCFSAFRRRATICVGCRRPVVYGATQDEIKAAMTTYGVIAGAFTAMLLGTAPNYLNEHLRWTVAPMWG